MKSGVSERVRIAYRIYDERLRSHLEPDHLGKIVAIHVDTGDYYLGSTPREACEQGRHAHPGAVFVCRPIGRRTLYRVGTF